jgi:hypothetical protein
MLSRRATTGMTVVPESGVVMLPPRGSASLMIDLDGRVCVVPEQIPVRYRV